MTITPVYRKIIRFLEINTTITLLPVSPEMERMRKNLSLAWQKNQLLWSIIEGVTQWVCEQVPSSNDDRRLDALDGWIGNRWESVDILSFLVLL